MKIVIEIDDARFKDIKRIACVQFENHHFKTTEQIIANGTPLLDEIRTEIDRQEKWLMSAGYNAYNVDIAFNSIRSVVKESEE